MMAYAFKRRKYKMNNVERIQQTTKDIGDAATTSVHTFATAFQTIASAHADFAKKVMQHNSEFMSQLTSVKEPAKLMEVQSEYVKNGYEMFVVESKRLAELYADVFKRTTKPFEDLIAKNKAA
jgi:phasin family protein